MSGMTLKLGTRRSLLATAQSAAVAREIERLNPGMKIELVGIDTQGDKIVDVPLSQVQGKEFFVKELDEALLDGRVDLTVHSMKDLSLERPDGIVLGAVPRRQDPRDVVVFRDSVIERMKRGESIRIGTSAPRRLENLPHFLKMALPVADAKLEFCEIRGNVNTRLGRLHEHEGSERRVEGVVLAVAGLERLHRDPHARVELLALLKGTRWMVLPVTECPTAPAQGALAIECRSSDTMTQQALSRLHDASTEAAVRAEREILQEWGGGCHQSLGATQVSLKGLGDVLLIKGRKPSGSLSDEVRWNSPSSPGVVPASEIWDGSLEGSSSKHFRTRRVELPDLSGKFCFVAHARALEGVNASTLAGARIWCSGAKTWRKLAARGFWVEGCAESLGFDYIAPTLELGVLGLGQLDQKIVFTHAAAVDSWKSGRVFATYELGEDVSVSESFTGKRFFYWANPSQFDKFAAQLPQDASHACGPGKTLDYLQSKGLRNLHAFPSVEEWRRWLKIEKN